MSASEKWKAWSRAVTETVQCVTDKGREKERGRAYFAWCKGARPAAPLSRIAKSPFVKYELATSWRQILRRAAFFPLAPFSPFSALSVRARWQKRFQAFAITSLICDEQVDMDAGALSPRYLFGRERERRCKTQRWVMSSKIAPLWPAASGALFDDFVCTLPRSLSRFAFAGPQFPSVTGKTAPWFVSRRVQWKLIPLFIKGRGKCFCKNIWIDLFFILPMKRLQGKFLILRCKLPCNTTDIGQEYK